MKIDRHDDPTAVFFASLDAGDLFFTEPPEIAECSDRASILFMKEDGMGDAAGIDHPAEGLQKFAHLSRTEFKWAMPASISFSGQSGKISRACSASLT